MRRPKYIEYMITALIILALMCVAKTAFGREGVKIDIETVAGIDCEKAVKILQAMEEQEAEQARIEEQIQEDIDLMAHLIYAENGDDSYREYMRAMRYTGSVVLNRMASDRYPDTLEGVIYQRGQYACTWDGHIHRTPSDDAYEVAEDLIRNGSALPEDVLFAAEFRQGHVYDYVAGTYYCY